MDESEFNLERVCRACKTESEGMFSVFESEAMHDHPTKLAEMLMACTSIQISIGDGMPTMMCITCIQQLNTAFSFKKQCETTDVFLREYLRQNNIKMEGNGGNQTAQDAIPSILDFNTMYTNELSQEEVKDIKPDISQGADIPSVNEEKSPYVCNVCDKRFGNVKSLKYHKRKHRVADAGDGDVYKCAECGEQFTRMSCFRQHMRVHQPRRVHMCKICNKTVYFFEYLKRHLVSHLKIKPHVCDICHRGFKRPDHLINHAKQCKGLRSFVCDICNKGFTREDSLQLHMDTHDSKANLQVLDSVENFLEHYIEVDNNVDGEVVTVAADDAVSSCSDYSFNDDADDVDSDKQLEDMEKISNSLAIKLEDDSEKHKSDDSLDNSNVQERDAHLNDEEWMGELPMKRKRGRPRKGEVRPPKQKMSKRLKGNLEKYPCEQCDKKFARLSHLNRHLESHENDLPFKCELCVKSFADEEQLQAHAIDHTKLEILECEICEEKFPGIDRLTKHKAVKHKIIASKQPSEKKFKCHVCTKGFTTQKYRDIHERAHAGEKFCSCKTCGKRFNTKAHLTEHMKFHDECAKKFLCSECGQRFIRYDYLVIHMRRHRGEKPFKCRYCGKGKLNQGLDHE